MTLYLASGNAHKKQEMAEIFSPYTVRTPDEDGIRFDPEETGSSFMQNSLIKAKTLWELVKKPVIADDSGICTAALGGRPGIYSARYAGKEFPQGFPDGHKLSSTEQNSLLLQEIAESAFKDNRKCMYVCAMVFYYGENRFAAVQETMEGVLVPDMQHAYGSGGFGYDPIVIIPEFGKTVAALTEDEKNRISHRGKACRQLKLCIDRYFSRTE